MIAQELEVCLHMAFVKAREKRHRVITVEHLLLELLETPEVSELAAGRGVDIDAVRLRLARYIDTHAARFAKDEEVDTQPNTEFQRVIQDAILRVQSSGKAKVTGDDVFSAIARQKYSAAARLLNGAELADGPVKAGDQEPEEVNELTPATPEQIEHENDLMIVLLNDDRTPMEFVVDLLQKFFAMNRDEAVEAMLEVHRLGNAVVGLYPREEAKDLLAEVLQHIRAHGHPLRCVLIVPK